MAFVFVVKVNESLITKIFKFLQLLVFELIDLRRGLRNCFSNLYEIIFTTGLQMTLSATLWLFRASIASWARHSSRKPIIRFAFSVRTLFTGLKPYIQIR